MPLALAAGAWYAVGKMSFTVAGRDGVVDAIASAKLQNTAQIVAALLVYKVAAK